MIALTYESLEGSFSYPIAYPISYSNRLFHIQLDNQLDIQLGVLDMQIHMQIHRKMTLPGFRRISSTDYPLPTYMGV